MSQALYRKYRSKSLKDIVGQDHITSILERALKAGKIAHAYLLTGPRGVGKTSVARILAHEINQLPYNEDSTHLDIIEIDAASNNGVEDVRDLREKVRLAPVSASKKVYIIDEVHMLSKPAFNALLKTLEEPPEHVVFILATTDVEKLPATIVSRTQRYGFRAIGVEDAVKHLKNIAKEEKINVTDDAVKLIAERGDGSFRDSISLLDQLSSLADDKQGITTELVEASLGLAPISLIDDLLDATDKHDVGTIASLLEKSANEGISAVTLTEQLTNRLMNSVVESPQLLPLLDSLLDVAKSSQPQLKLLSVLGSFATSSKAPKTAALTTPVLEVTATIEELSRQATKKKPSLKNDAGSISSVSKHLQPDSAPERQPDATASVKPFTNGTKRDSEPFNWQSLVDYARDHFVALYSVLRKCGHQLSGDELTLYTGNAFYKKKLDDPRYGAHLYESLQAIGSYQLTVHILPTPTPPTSSQAAAVAAIMGGGQEVAPEAL